MRVLITGITGFVGSHMADYLLSMGHDVYGIKRWRSPLDNIKHCSSKLKLYDADLRDQSSLITALRAIEPEVILHLAAQSYVPTSCTAPVDTYCTNVLGTTNLLEAVRILNQDPSIMVCSSSEVYGQVNKDEVPIKETNQFRPSSPYAISKAAKDLMAWWYWKAYGMKITRSRAFTHSVSKWTPVIVRNTKSGLIDIKYISEIRQMKKRGGYLSGKMLDDGTQIWDMDRHNLEVWNDGAWTKILHISCHPLNGHKLLEVKTISGVVDATDNHSIIRDNGGATVAGELKIGDNIKVAPMPKVEITELNEDMAWVYGFFVAEGCSTGGKLRIDNTDIARINKAKNILLKYFTIDSTIYGNNGLYRLSCRNPFKHAKQFYQDCYASDGNKKIPQIILNASVKTKLAFLSGYNEGDGEISDTVKSEFYRFKTKSPILAAGLCYLVESALGVKYRVHVEHRDDKRFYEIRCLNQVNSSNGRHLIKADNEINSIRELPYEDEVWDFETENHWFTAGVGGIVVHNTGPRRGRVFALSAFAHQIALIEAGKQDTILKVGNLASVRTWLDVRDIVKAYWLLATKGVHGEAYNIGGDFTCTIGQALTELLCFSPLKDAITVEADPALFRAADVTLQIPDVSKFKEVTGWKPEIPFSKTCSDILDYWRTSL